MSKLQDPSPTSTAHWDNRTRLAYEWLTRAPVIAVDFDDTVHKRNLNSDVHTIAVNLLPWVLKRAVDLGAIIVCFTCRPPSDYQFILQTFEEKGIRLHAINEHVVKLQDSDFKLFYNLLIDDRAGPLLPVIRMLQCTMDTVERYRQEKLSPSELLKVD